MTKITKIRQLEKLSREIGIPLPAEVKKAPPAAGRGQTLRVLNFAIKNKLTINPVGYGYHIDSFAEFKCCPCDRTRKDCPCDQVLAEIKTQGYCKCHLFWRDLETYLAKF